MHCADRKELVFNVKALDILASIDLFTNKVQKSLYFSVDQIERNQELRELISKCGGLPKVIVAMADYAQSVFDWHARVCILNNMFIHNLENRPQFASLHGVFSWMHSYLAALPKYLKQHVAYLLIFPGNSIIRRRRLLMRWIAEGYSTDSEFDTAVENGEEIFTKLVKLSMLQLPQDTTIWNLRMSHYTVNGFMHKYMISRPEEENIAAAIELFSLVGTCSSTSQRRGRHLVIEESWERDSIVFESIDFSRLRSLTVFGEWRRFFISASMKVLRVLDLENASGMRNKDVQMMLKLLPRLKFLSLRGCSEVTYLPNSLGDLRQLQTLDIRQTSIFSLPASITKLKKLQYLRVGTTFPLKNPSSAGGAVFKLPKLRTCCQVAGVKVESVLTALHTLGVVNVSVSGGAAILKEFMDLTQLRKLGVSGVGKSNIKEFWSAVSNHSHLHSLSVWHIKYRDSLFKMPNECSLPKRLQSLKLYGLAEKLPGWMRQLVTLRKLNLDIDILSQEDIEILGILPELCILRLRVKPPPPSGRLNFCLTTAGAEDRFYNKVKLLEIACCSSSIDVSFGSLSMQRLELLRVGCFGGSVLKFADLRHCFCELKEVHIVHSPDGALDLEDKLIDHPRQPTLKHLEMTSAVQFPFRA
ncbi:hypothetical protein PR202_ga12202 [Eleusine coracana subsp. coracana]|uniref:NB-ARC domain-containing protein n=1 Tax=Eleusine coracana subsp. coracana TaxID=191504 RepID=A0AAV5CBG5_ELECO|nr:hypothetical protein PR202_ga12202 [Eleusine coracana subsp. coracana]